MWQVAVNAFVYVRHFRLTHQCRQKMGRYPNVAVPVSFEEKFLWRKIFDRNPLFQQISDKLLAKQFAASRLPNVSIPRTLWVGVDFNDIPEELLKGPAVLKSNHASGQFYFLRGQAVDRDKLKAMTDNWLARPYGQGNGEWAYRGIDRKIFIEELVTGLNGEPLEDYNVYVMNGVVRHTQCLRQSHGPNPTNTRYDRDGSRFEAQYSPTFEYEATDPPAQYREIVRMAERLGAGFDHIRCDFYLCGSVIYFCEMTVYSVAGFPYAEGRLRRVWETSWDIRHSWFLTTPQSGWRGIYAKYLRSKFDEDRNQSPA